MVGNQPFEETLETTLRVSANRPNQTPRDDGPIYFGSIQVISLPIFSLWVAGVESEMRASYLHGFFKIDYDKISEISMEKSK